MAHVERNLIASLLRATPKEQRDYFNNPFSESAFSRFDREYMWILNQHEKFGKVPSAAAFRSKFPAFKLVKLRDALGVHIDLMNEKTQYNSIRSVLNETSSLLGTDKISAAMGVMRRWVEESRQVQAGISDVDWAKVNNRLSAYKKRSTTKPFISTPWKSLNRLIAGVQPENLTTIAGRMGLGKTWFMLYWAYFCYKVLKKRVLIITKEMSTDEMLDRLDAMAFQLDWELFRRGELPQKQFKRYAKGRKKLLRAAAEGLFISGEETLEGVGMEQVQSKINQYQPDIVFVDGAYLIEAHKGGSLVEQMVHLTRRFKRLAKARKVAMVITMQMNRKAESEKGGNLATLSWSDSIGTDSDFVFEVAGKRTDHDRLVKVLKGRNSSMGEFRINFQLSPKVNLGQKVSVMHDESMEFDETGN